MESNNSLKFYKNNRQWYQLCKEIIKSITKDNSNIIYSLYLESITQYHPLTITESSLLISKYLQFKDAISLLEKSKNVIKECNMYHGDFNIQIVHLEIQMCLYKIEIGEFKQIEKKLYEFKKMDLPVKVYELYNFLGFKYFEKTGNIEYCINYLINYIELSKDKTYYEILAKYTLISRKFFNFMRVYAFEGFSEIRINSIYEIVQNGETKRIEKEKNELKKIFTQEEVEILIEKTYFIGLINLCFKEKSRKIELSKIQEILGINENDLNSFLVKAFGLNLLKGWIDEVKGILYFSTILPRTLPKEELEKMKDKFGVWKRKVKEAISMLE
ncbi:26S proteasome non-ATPase regulatory subunit 13 [Nosema bombycis CQ1]|uniref:26S proteasome non-ATPase regulatory subunit 13 n=1 Tax=Nosema bombycis (strain CQ1 / CVCC 102059) TaxID=578461 RepID=R0M0Q0_NOSB1|nr:26S proteasome non-ATPase regulatory subunit 13 [Nosema bombycis CQ1]|eukprot:EOB11604.1 26S proteasome non-ATPase regulatory subunit 13 [Nosema bombycis CQ1]